MSQAGFFNSSSVGSGDVVGPGSSTAGDIAIFSNTTGKLLSDSGILSSKVLFATPQTVALDFTQPMGTAYPIYTVPAGKTFICLFIISTTVALTDFSGDGNLSVGSNSPDYDNLLGPAGSGNTFSTYFSGGTDSYNVVTCGLGASLLTSGQTAYVNIISPVTATIATETLNLIGMFL